MTIYLSRLILNPRSRQVQAELARPYELHRTLMRGFPDGVKREGANLLHRLEIHPRTGALTLLAQSTLKPDWTYLQNGKNYLLDPPQSKPINLHLPAGRTLRFRLVANPTVKKKRDDKKHSNRVPLVREEKQTEWLKEKKGQQHGFHVLSLRISQMQKHTFWKSKQKDKRPPLSLYTVQFDGLLEITDAEKFAQALQTGIGPAKAFGCGLLSLAPA